jgi:predicted Zn finger-like uncharacterized protein
MMISCPACATRYAVPDSAIGVDGRVVRCAKCRHSWFQDGPDPTEGIAEAPESPVSPPVIDEVAPPAIAEPAAGSYAPATYAEPPVAPDFDETPSSFAHEPPFRPRRNPARFWIWAFILLLLVAGAAIAAMASFGIPDWLPVPHGALAEAQPDLRLNFPPNQQEWRPLPNGNTFFNVSGSIANASMERRAVPTLEIVLRDAHKAVVYSLETASPKAVLAPGESETIDQAIIDAPKSARVATIGWKAR